MRHRRKTHLGHCLIVGGEQLLVAFIVDFHYGTIYLPGTSADGGEDGEAPLKTVKIDGELTPDAVEAVLARETGTPVPLEAAEIRLAEGRTRQEIRALLAVSQEAAETPSPGGS